MRSPGEIYEFTIRDIDSGDIIRLKYRKPYTREKIEYHASLWNMEKKELKPDEEIDEIRVKWGGEIIEGIELESNRRARISSNPESEHYLSTWKDWLKEKAPQVLETLALKVFQGFEFGEVTKKKSEEKAPEKKSEETTPEKKS